MLKIRITFSQDSPEELQEVLAMIEQNFNVLSQSQEYKGRGKSKYSNIYLDVENKK